MPKRHRGTVRPIRSYAVVGAPPTSRARQSAVVAADRRIGLAMLPLRLFLGLTFVYAGLDKLLFDPTFLDSAAPTSLLAQLEGFAHTSPLAPLITLIAEPFVVPMGIAVAVAEIAAGLGALTGLLPRASAWGGFAIAALLWLTASFAIHPYYLGPDLPYGACSLMLALIGAGDVLTVRPSLGRWLVWLGIEEPEAYPDRRRFLHGVLLGGVAVATGGFGWLLGEAGRSSLSARLAAHPTASPTPLATGAAPTPKGALGTLTSLKQQGGSISFQVPSGSLAGDPAVVVLLSNGTAAAYDAVCTHAGCTVSFDATSDELFCPCHGATFDPRNHGAVLGGPTNIPLPEVPINVDAQTGVITLVGST
jgi:thiosulfate dehydrogenase [quinone] large subunit